MVAGWAAWSQCWPGYVDVCSALQCCGLGQLRLVLVTVHQPAEMRENRKHVSLSEDWNIVRPGQAVLLFMIIIKIKYNRNAPFRNQEFYCQSLQPTSRRIARAAGLTRTGWYCLMCLHDNDNGSNCYFISDNIESWSEGWMRAESWGVQLLNVSCGQSVACDQCCSSVGTWDTRDNRDTLSCWPLRGEHSSDTDIC